MEYTHISSPHDICHQTPVVRAHLAPFEQPALVPLTHLSCRLLAAITADSYVLGLPVVSFCPR